MKPSEFLLQLQQINQESLINTKGIGEVLANNFQEFLASDRFKKLVSEFEKLEELGLAPNIILEVSNKNGILAGKTVCITGTLSRPRPEIKTFLESLGAKVVDTVSGKLNYLLAGESAGSKLEKAEKLVSGGLEIVGEDWLNGLKSET